MAEVLNLFQHGQYKYSTQERRLDSQPKPITYERKRDPNATTIDFERVPPKVIDKPVGRIVEVLKPVPVDKVVERLRERMEVTEKCRDGYTSTVYDEILKVEEVTKPVTFERIVHKEVVQEVMVDKFVDLIIEVIKEVPVTRVVERKVEVIEEVPFVRYVDRVITKPVPVTRVVERVVEVIKEVPVETIREVPVYVKVDVSTGEELQSRDRINWSRGATVTYTRQAAAPVAVAAAAGGGATSIYSGGFTGEYAEANGGGGGARYYTTATEYSVVGGGGAPYQISYGGPGRVVAEGPGGPGGAETYYRPAVPLAAAEPPRPAAESAPPPQGVAVAAAPPAGQDPSLRVSDSGAAARKWEEALM